MRPTTRNFFVCDFDYVHIGKAVGDRICLLKGTGTEYNGGSHVYLTSRYQESNASPSILEFLDLIRTNDLEQPYATPLGRKAQERIQAVRSGRVLEMSYRRSRRRRWINEGQPVKKAVRKGLRPESGRRSLP